VPKSRHAPLSTMPSPEEIRDLVPSRPSRNTCEDHMDDAYSESLGTTTDGESDDQQCYRNWHHRGLAAVVVISAILLVACSWLNLPTSSLHDTRTAKAPKSTTFSSKNALELLQGRQLQDTIANAAVHLGELAVTLHQHQHSTRHTVHSQIMSKVQLPSSEIKRIKSQAQREFKKVLHAFFVKHSEAAGLLANVPVSADQASGVSLMLRALTDHRVLTVGMKAAWKCAGSQDSPESLARCLGRHAKADELHLRHLREELLPTEVCAHMRGSLKHYHVELLSRGVFKAASDVAGWHADLEVRFRSLRSSDVFSPSQVFHSPARTPINWFTIGAPVVSHMLGLVFLSLMALLPGTGGLPTDRAANYALWGIQSAATVGECLANVGSPQGVLYLASCIIDVLNLGLEVIWVFFDGQKVSGPRRQANCISYSQWPRIQGVCGNCMALVAGAEFQNRCDIYCNDFGHRAVFAARAVPGSCFPQARYGISEHIPSDVMLCLRDCSTSTRLSC